MTQEEINFREELMKRVKIHVTHDDFFSRSIQISPIPGRHENPAGYSIAVSGTPPKALLFCIVTGSNDWAGYLYSFGKMHFVFDTASFSPRKNNKFGTVVLNYLRSMGYIKV